MKVEDIYQDEEGNWHIDYGLTQFTNSTQFTRNNFSLVKL